MKLSENHNTKKKQRNFNIQNESFFNLAGLILLVLDSKGVVTRINRKGCHILGYSEKYILGKNWFDHFLPQPVRKQVKKVYQQLMTGKIKPAEYYENPVLAKSGREKIIAWHNAVLRDEKDSIIGTLGSGEDITEHKQAEQALLESEEKYQLLVENAPSVLWKTSEKGITVFISSNIKEVYGFTPEEIYTEGYKSWLSRIHHEDLQKVKKSYKTLFSKGEKFDIEYRIKRKDGEWIWLHDLANVVREEKGERYAYGVFTDITERKQAEQALRESEKKYRTFFKTVRDCVFITSKDGRWMDLNDAAVEMFGYESKEELRKVKIPDLYAKAEDRRQHIKLIEKQGYEKENPADLKKKDGSIIHTLITTVPVTNGQGTVVAFQGTIRDITKQQKAKERIKQNLKEKEVLLQEIHHRVKNNLSVITSLLNLQANKITNKKQAVQAFQETKNRIYSMALVHEKLYTSQDFSNIDMKSYVKSVSRQLTGAYSSGKEMTLDVNVSNVFLTINKAVPCGLILNELVTNAIIHGFSRRRKGIIRISFRMMKNKNCEFIVQDNGSGLPPDTDIQTTDSFGLKLVYLLTKQIDGTVQITRKDGTRFRIVFPV